MREQRVSPEQFSVLKDELNQMELEGYGPEACVIGACNAARIKPPQPFETVQIIVDAGLSGGSYK
jgi:hypothetical protein